MRFNYSQFDNLKGMQLYNHAREVAEQNLVDPDVVRMFRCRIGAMDLQHSEMMLLILAKSSCEEAHIFLAEFLIHPNLSLRFTASKFVGQLASADERIMRSIVEAIRKGDDHSLREELDGILHRPTDENAKLVAEAFLASEPKVQE